MQLLQQVQYETTSYEVDPLLCECGAEMEVISFIAEYRVVIRILEHVRSRPDSKGRAPPG